MERYSSNFGNFDDVAQLRSLVVWPSPGYILLKQEVKISLNLKFFINFWNYMKLLTNTRKNFNYFEKIRTFWNILEVYQAIFEEIVQILYENSEHFLEKF